MELGLKGKSVIVTAASGGLGKAGAMEFTREGANVMIFSRREEELKQTVEDIYQETGNKVNYVVGDMTKPDDIKALVEATIEKYGRIDVLVNNTGGPKAGVFDIFNDEDWQQAYELTLLSYIRTIREVLPHMRKQGGGHIVNNTSSSVKSALNNLLLSNTFRMGVVGLTKTLSQELAKDNILINVIGPGRVATERIEQLDSLTATKLGITKEEATAKSKATIPLGRYGEPEEFARLMVFLCSEANTYITGQTILADGGLVKAY